MNDKWFSMSVGDAEQKLKTNAASGLTRKAARSAWYRENSAGRKMPPLFVRKTKPIGKMIGDVVFDFALVILLLAALFAVLLDDRFVGLTILTICTVSLIVSFVVYCLSERTMERMNLYFLPTAKVIRGGRLYRVSFENIVRGDVIVLEKGDIVPADARLVTSDKLSVLMRVDKEKYIPLQKLAEGVVSPDEINPAKMLNILHAGSTVTDGSARAIVYATGAFTYLGARTGGVELFYSDNTPKELKKMKKICSQMNMYSMLCILPFSIFSVFVSILNSGTSTLSMAFLTALAISASCMSQLSTTICKIFFIKKIKDIFDSKDTAVIRTTEAFDDLCGISYLFMTDGAAVTDGELHFDTAFTLEGELKNYQNITATITALYEAAAIYNSSQSSALTSGMNNLPDRYKNGINEFLKFCGADTEALKIRCTMGAYMPATANTPTDRVYYTDNGIKRVLDVSRTPDIFSLCSHVVVGGHVQPLSTVGADKLRHTYNIHASKGKTVLVFTLTDMKNNIKDYGKVFLGACVLREGIDKRAFSAISALEKNGVKIISFVNGSNSFDAPQIPPELHRSMCAYKDDFLRNQLPITYKFGEFDTYYGLNEGDISELLRFAHSQSRTVGVVDFSGAYPAVTDKADVFITCGNAVNLLSAKNEQELYTMEMEGAFNSASCNQTVKYSSNVLIPRPNGRRGGLSSLVNILLSAKTAYRNLSSFFKYLLSAQLLRIITAGLPAIFGNTVLDARHILLCSFIIDILVLFMLATDTKNVPNNNISQYKIKTLKEQIISFKSLLLSVVAVGVFAIVLPEIMDMTHIFGQYLYKTEYLFCALLWLHLLIAYYVRFGSVLNIKAILKNRLFVLLFILVVVFSVLLFTIPSFGILFEIVSNPLPYAIASVLPSILFIALVEMKIFK